MVQFTLSELAEKLDADIQGDGTVLIGGLNTIRSASPGDITFLSNPAYQIYLSDTRASAVLVSKEMAPACPVNALVVKDPYLAFARISRFFDTAPVPVAGIHETAVISTGATLGMGVSIGPHVVIEDGVCIDDGVAVGAGCYLGSGVKLGGNVRLFPNVTIYHGVSVGARSIIHSGAVLGADGFGFAFNGTSWEKVAQVGGVRIGADVEIGASTTIDRGAIEDTVIGQGVILDNQVQIAHNVVVGDHTAIAGRTAIAGSTRVGRHCMIGGAVGIAGHLEIVDGVQVMAMSFVSGSITEPGIYASGLPIDRHKSWQKNAIRFRSLDGLFRRVAALEKRGRGN